MQFRRLRKTHSCMLFPNCTQNHAIADANRMHYTIHTMINEASQALTVHSSLRTFGPPGIPTISAGENRGAKVNLKNVNDDLGLLLRRKISWKPKLN